MLTVRAGAALVGLSMSALACVSLDDPGQFDPRSPVEGSAAVSALRVAFDPWKADGDAEVAERFTTAMRAHLAAARLLPEPRTEGAQLRFQGELRWRYLPEKGGLAGPQAGGPHVLLWVPLTLLGVPVEWMTAEAKLVLVARDAPTDVPVAAWETATVSDTAYAGLYYHPAPLKRALRVAADELEALLRASLTDLQARVEHIDGWQQRYGTQPLDALDDRDPAIRGRALLAIAALGEGAQPMLSRVRARVSDAVPELRVRALDTLDAMRARDAATRATVAALREDGDSRVESRAYVVLRRMDVWAEADAISDPAVARNVVLLADPAASVRVSALRALEALGPPSRAATKAVSTLLGWSTVEEERRAAVAALLAAAWLDDTVATALQAATTGSATVQREAVVALAQLRALAPDPTANAEPRPSAAPREATTRSRAVVAVFELEGGRLTAQRRTELTALLAAQLTARARFKVVPDGRLRAQITDAKADSYQACYDTACQIEVGKAVAAEKIINSKLIEQADRCVISSTLYDLRSEATEHAAVVEGACTPAALRELVEQVAERLRPAP